jgi:hypothetical protein
MTAAVMYTLFADLILIVHFLIVIFIVGGLAAIIAGHPLNWAWIYQPYFRWGHLGAISVVVLQTWLGRLCPLTSWEQALRDQAGQDSYSVSFVQHWLHRLLFFEADMWAFGTAYTLFGALVLYYWLRDRMRIRTAGANSPGRQT